MEPFGVAAEQPSVRSAKVDVRGVGTRGVLLMSVDSFAQGLARVAQVANPSIGS